MGKNKLLEAGIEKAVAVSIERAKQIRKWRVEEGCSWRRISELAHEEWKDENIIPDVQIIGRELCLEAAQILNEDPFTKPWN